MSQGTSRLQRFPERPGAGLLLALALAGLPGRVAGQDGPSAASEPVAKHEKLEEKYGIAIQGIRRTAAGHILDFRYRVDDPARAAPLFERRSKPVLIAQSSGVRLPVPVPPTIGPLRSSNAPIAGRTYFVLFSNPDGFVKSGEAVTVEIGEFRAADLIVDRRGG